MEILVVGAGVFGLTGALELARRGCAVTVIAPGPWPDPDASSNDISKLIRMEYGADALYTELMERAFDGWEAWNQRWGRSLYHPDGLLALCHAVEPGSFEGDSLRFLRGRGHALEVLDAGVLAVDHPAWKGFERAVRNPVAGWAESGAVIRALASELEEAGVERREGRVLGLFAGPAGPGVVLGAETLHADRVVVANGAWIGTLLPELSDRIRPVGQPVLHLVPEEPERWTAPRFPPWAADIANTGWYGFPATEEGVVKLANHGAGTPTDPTGPRVVPEGWEGRARRFLGEHLPELRDAALVGTRLCLYADSFDGDFWIAPHPERAGVVIAGGGSGHGFKFAPVLGELIADAVEGRTVARFAWREAGGRRTEAARSS